MSDQAPDNAETWTDERKAATANAGAATANLNRAIAQLQEIQEAAPDQMPPGPFIEVAAAIGGVAQAWAILDLAEQTRIGNLLDLAARMESRRNHAVAAQLVDQAAESLKVSGCASGGVVSVDEHRRGAPLPYPAELGEGLGQ